MLEENFIMFKMIPRLTTQASNFEQQKILTVAVGSIQENEIMSTTGRNYSVFHKKRPPTVRDRVYPICSKIYYLLPATL